MTTTRNYETKQGIISRLERELKNKEYSLNLAKPYKDDVVNPYYYTSALYDYNTSVRDLKEAK